MMDKSKLLPYGLAIVATGVAVWTLNRPSEDIKVVTKIETVQVVKEVEKVVTKERVKWKTRIVYQPDGTTVVDEEGESETDSSSDKTTDSENRSKEDTKVTVNSKTYPYSIGVSCNNILACGDFRNYSIIGSVRLGTLPLSITAGTDITFPPNLSLGVRFDF